MSRIFCIKQNFKDYLMVWNSYSVNFSTLNQALSDMFGHYQSSNKTFCKVQSNKAILNCWNFRNNLMIRRENNRTELIGNRWKRRNLFENFNEICQIPLFSICEENKKVMLKWNERYSNWSHLSSWTGKQWNRIGWNSAGLKKQFVRRVKRKIKKTHLLLPVSFFLLSCFASKNRKKK